MSGEHGYLRRDAHKALTQGLAGKFPASWKVAEENAAVEVWLTIRGATAVCGLRLSDRTMRHRTYKLEHRPASLRPTLAAAMVQLAGARPGQVVLDPMCGAGTLLAEQLLAAERYRGATIHVWGGDRDAAAVHAAEANLSKLGEPLLASWDARRLPLADGVVDHILSNPPFGNQLLTPEEIGPLYAAMIQEYHRVLKPGGQAVLIVSDLPTLRNAIPLVGWKSKQQLQVRILGQSATITVWRKPLE
jgi:23S rRNA G2445 N2-methylase RlmL